MLIKESHLLTCRYLEHLGPSQQRISFYRRILRASFLNPVEKNIHRCTEIVQLNRNAKPSGCEPQGIPLRLGPRAPLDDYCEAKYEKIFSELPLESFNLRARLFVVDIQRKGIHPFVCGKRVACRLLSSRFACVVLPEPGKPHTIINLGPLPDRSMVFNVIQPFHKFQLDFHSTACLLA